MTEQERDTPGTDNPDDTSHKRLAIPQTDDPGTGAVPGMANLQARIVTGVFMLERQANRAARELYSAGFAEDTVIVAAQPEGTAPVLSASDTYARSGLRSGVIAGAAIGLVLGILLAIVAPTADWLPLGPGALIVAALLVGMALGALLGSFRGLGKQTRHADEVESATRSGGFTLTVRTSTASDRDRASAILHSEGAQVVSNHQEAL